MSELPQGWAPAPLGALGSWGSGGTPSKSNADYYANGTIPWLVIGDLNDSVVVNAATRISEKGLANCSAKLLAPNTLLIAMYGSIGKLGITGFECATNQAIAFCKPNELINLRYVFRAMQHMQPALMAHGQGGAQLNISQTILKAQEIPLAPFPEQKRIADKLDSMLVRVDACRDRLDRLSALLKRFRQSILAAATSGYLTEDWRASFVKAQRNESEINEVTDMPPTWLQLPLKELCEVVSGYAFKSTEFVSSGILAVKISNIQYGYFEEKNQEYLPPTHLNEYAKFSINPGDLLLALTRPITNGRLKVCQYPNDLATGLLNQRVCKIQCKNLIVDRYFFLYMQSSIFLEQVSAGLSETLQPNLSPKDLECFVIKTPPLPEQTEIVRRVEILFAFADRLEARLATARRQVGQLTPSLLAKAFRGELAPQDPADEPAAELLKRLAAQRETPPKPKRGLTKA